MSCALASAADPNILMNVAFSIGLKLFFHEKTFLSIYIRKVISGHRQREAFFSAIPL
jgi:hypothetical protein